LNATTTLERVARALRLARLEAILVGNAAAAIQGAPVTTLDFDFLIRDTPRASGKIKAFARSLRAAVTSPYEPVSRLVRVSTVDIQVDLLPFVHGVSSFEGLRSRAARVRVGEEAVRVASLEDVIKSKRAAGRKKDLAVLPVLEDTLREKRKQSRQGR
jgi:predicted nucleotidyltransferase